MAGSIGVGNTSDLLADGAGIVLVAEQRQPAARVPPLPTSPAAPNGDGSPVALQRPLWAQLFHEEGLKSTEFTTPRTN
eukprot:gene21376-57313_t